MHPQLRSFLPIPADTKIMIERYSDSAAAYVMLDASNMAVYKQLYRAAKAKSKLKLRVSAMPDNEEASPEPVTVEDAPEVAPEVAQAAATSRTESIDSNSTTAVSASSSRTTLSRKYDAALLQEAARIIQDHQADFDDRIRQVMRSRNELASLTSQMASCQPFISSSEEVSKPADPLPPACPAAATRFTVYCNSCEKTIPDAHYHCSTCNDGDFDLCESCVGQGITCYSDDHWLIKRSMSDGQIVNSTTETVSPKLKAKSASEPKTQPETQPETQPMTQPMTELVKPLSGLTLPAVGNATVGEITYPSIPPIDGPWPNVDNIRTCNQCVRGWFPFVFFSPSPPPTFPHLKPSPARIFQAPMTIALNSIFFAWLTKNISQSFLSVSSSTAPPARISISASHALQGMPTVIIPSTASRLLFPAPRCQLIFASRWLLAATRFTMPSVMDATL